MNGYYAKIGTMPNGKNYYFNVPYNASESFKNYVSGEKDVIASTWFGYEREPIVKTMYAVQFNIEDYNGFDPETYEDRKEYKIHYHMMSTEGYENCYHPTLLDKDKKELVFLSPEEACDFLIKFMEDNEITEVNIKEATKDIQQATKEVKRLMSVVNRITEAINYK